MGLWLLSYKINDADHDRYIEWFEQTHIDEKLAREGYDWAAHYRVIDNNSPTHYLAMFGSATTRTFFDPSPKQLKPTQTPLTKEMIGMRQQPLSLICSFEWSCSTAAAVNEEYLALDIFNSDNDDQDVTAWCAQQYFPALETNSAVRNAYKLLSSSGDPRHLCLVEINSKPNSKPSVECLKKTDSAAKRSQLLAKRVLFKAAS